MYVRFAISNGKGNVIKELTGCRLTNQPKAKGGKTAGRSRNTGLNPVVQFGPIGGGV